MKLFINHLDKNIIKEKLSHLNELDFSLFIDEIPRTQDDLSSINILVLQEPNEYFKLHEWAINNKELFSFILTWSDLVLNNCDNSLFLPFGHTWFRPNQYNKNHEKKFQIAHLSGKLLKTYGHSLRHEILNRSSEISMPKKFYYTYGDRYDIENARKGKEEIFGDSMFGVAIENTSHRGYFTEKILDLFLLKTIPVYWGCSNINIFFNEKGMIKFENIDDFIYISNQLDERYYYQHLDIIEENYKLALSYVDYEQKIVDKITEIFKLNYFI